MALHVPKAPGFAQMLKEGAKVRAAPGEPALFTQEDGGGGVLSWRRGKGSGRPAGPGSSTRPAGRGPEGAPSFPPAFRPLGGRCGGGDPPRAAARRAGTGRRREEGGARRTRPSRKLCRARHPCPAPPGSRFGVPPPRGRSVGSRCLAGREHVCRPAARAAVSSGGLRGRAAPRLWRRRRGGLVCRELLWVVVGELAPGSVELAVQK